MAFLTNDASKYIGIDTNSSVNIEMVGTGSDQSASASRAASRHLKRVRREQSGGDGGVTVHCSNSWFG